jgi:hypothetical protein
MKKVFYSINFKSGANRLQEFANIKEFGSWWRNMVKLGIYKGGCVLNVKPIQSII